MRNLTSLGYLKRKYQEDQRKRNIKAIKERLSLTLENIKYQKNICYWDDLEKLENCINKLKLMY